MSRADGKLLKLHFYRWWQKSRQTVPVSRSCLTACSAERRSWTPQIANLDPSNGCFTPDVKWRLIDNVIWSMFGLVWVSKTCKRYLNHLHPKKARNSFCTAFLMGFAYGLFLKNKWFVFFTTRYVLIWTWELVQNSDDKETSNLPRLIHLLLSSHFSRRWGDTCSLLVSVRCQRGLN